MKTMLTCFEVASSRTEQYNIPAVVPSYNHLLCNLTPVARSEQLSWCLGTPPPQRGGMVSRGRSSLRAWCHWCQHGHRCEQDPQARASPDYKRKFFRQEDLTRV